MIDDDASSGGFSPERPSDPSDGLENVCEWRGCGARFESVARLSAHVARTHALSHADGFFYCRWRGCARTQKGFNARYKMIVHMRIHTNERPHVCSQCQKSFSRAENLKIHLRSHSGEKPYVCPYEGCGKAYSNSSDRFKHTRTHKIEKPYACKAPGCNKRYTDPSSLRKHVKAYRHFTNDKDIVNNAEERISPKSTSPTPIYTDHSSHIMSQTRLSPFPYSQFTTYPEPAYVPLIESPYGQAIQPVFHRVPHHELSYGDYNKMYDHAYSSYYSPRADYPNLNPIVDEKVYSYEAHDRMDITADERTREYRENHEEIEVPLNLICAKRLQCKPFEDLVIRTELPLDLSTKS
ncbi:zinc finger protein GLIS2-like isoform X2 [Leptidea sinapis]|uniref:zinc finger protein GLIS2-like isoform X2 n=1 Tax=Leptidea sinapis TaxID=189913 RepID=UPI00213F75D8|nr:zinc finger protein GLIS2-like isoform X2 [Leptidea sinapis]